MLVKHLYKVAAAEVPDGGGCTHRRMWVSIALADAPDGVASMGIEQQRRRQEDHREDDREGDREDGREEMENEHVVTLAPLYIIVWLFCMGQWGVIYRSAYARVCVWWWW